MSNTATMMKASSRLHERTQVPPLAVALLIGYMRSPSEKRELLGSTVAQLWPHVPTSKYRVTGIRREDILTVPRLPKVE